MKRNQQLLFFNRILFISITSDVNFRRRCSRFSFYNLNREAEGFWQINYYRLKASQFRGTLIYRSSWILIVFGGKTFMYDGIWVQLKFYTKNPCMFFNLMISIEDLFDNDGTKLFCIYSHAKINMQNLWTIIA